LKDYLEEVQIPSAKSILHLCTAPRERAFAKKNINVAWAASGLIPLNPNKILRNIPKPPELKLDKWKVGYAQEEII
jgi:hypothetical protein